MKQLYKPITLHQLFTRSQLTIFILCICEKQPEYFNLGAE